MIGQADERISCLFLVNMTQVLETVVWSLTVIKAVIRKSANNKHWRVYEKKELAYTVGDNVNWYNHYGEQYGGSLKN